MDEIIYIARIDARPWARSASTSKSIVPFVLFFASLETTRYLLNSHMQVPEFEKYFVTALAAMAFIFLHDLGIVRWRTAYTIKFIQDLFFIALISTAAFNAVSAVLPDRWFTIIDSAGAISDAKIKFAVGMLMSAVGVTFVMLRTHLHRRGEYKRLLGRPGAAHFRRFRVKETQCLAGVYFADYILTSALITYLVTRAA